MALKTKSLKKACQYSSPFIDFPDVYVSQRLFNLHNIFCKKATLLKNINKIKLGVHAFSHNFQIK